MAAVTPNHPSAEPFSYSAYLRAKVSVDDRALNRDVIGVLQAELAQLPTAPRVLELGAGIGTMLARLCDWGVLRAADYTLLDVDARNLVEAPQFLAHWAAANGCSCVHSESGLSIRGGARELELRVHFTCAELSDFLQKRKSAAVHDLLLANAFLDLVDLPSTLPALFAHVVPGGLYWFTINFDGESMFLPDHPLDHALLSVYHRSMDERTRAGRPAGSSRTGRALFTQLPAAHASLLRAGSSDWVVHARDGHYPHEERSFVAQILLTIEAELNWRSEVSQPDLATWLATRRAQLARGELAFVAHQLDFVGTVADAARAR